MRVRQSKILSLPWTFLLEELPSEGTVLWCGQCIALDELHAISLFWYHLELRQCHLSEVDIESIVSNKERIVPAGVDARGGAGQLPFRQLLELLARRSSGPLFGHGYAEYTTYPQK